MAVETIREVVPTWNHGMIAASIAVSLIGTFTSTQLMCQARMSLHITSVLTWTLLGSLTFGFCSIWCLHFVAMLACELDLPIGIDIGLTVLSALLAVVFTFLALGTDLLWASYTRKEEKERKNLKKLKKARKQRNGSPENESSLPLLGPLTLQQGRDEGQEMANDHVRDLEAGMESPSRPSTPSIPNGRPHLLARRSSERALMASLARNESFQRAKARGDFGPIDEDDNAAIIQLDSREADSAFMKTDTEITSAHMLPEAEQFIDENMPDDVSDTAGTDTESNPRTSSDLSLSRRSSSFSSSLTGTSSHGIGSLMNLAYKTTSVPKNAFIAAFEALAIGFTVKNILRGFVWSLAITSMHYSGILALQIPEGFVSLSTGWVLLSAMISWVVCVVGSSLMSQMEASLAQQILFSFVATTGVAAMHFTGMRATTFQSYTGPSEVRGYPPQLAIAIIAIAIITCMLANGLLAHAATMSRNKLAEIVYTRRKLWRTIAQKETAEQAAAARSEFIASASHEIRTPLHHLQGYSDLLSRTELTEEGKILLYAIQRATKTLSLITNNVLDWSKLESNKDALCRPVALDMRSVCESIIVLLPNKDDEAEVEVMVVIEPNVPKSLFLDETYIHRILMNLLSNALKFTRAGYVLLMLEMSGSNLVAKIQDTGCGVPPSFLPQLFEPFSQAQARIGSQRGTGLGLSIVKQLLHKMQGTIDVQSRHPELEDIGPDETGSKFTISIPVKVDPSRRASEPIIESPTVAMFQTSREKSQAGVRLAWEHFGYNVVMVTDCKQLENIAFKYIWADLIYLEKNTDCLNTLLARSEWTVLVPHDSQVAIQRLPGALSSSHFVPLQRPLIWHTFEARVTIAEQASNKTLLRSVRFASKVDVLDGQNKSQPRESSTSKNVTVLLVEDNPINQKLGSKMLTSLGYDVILAPDGQEAIIQITAHDTTIDMILMDQSMPIKDGVTATREIRALEANGTLSRRHPIVAVTAVVNTESRALFKDAGADDFLAKPLGLGKLEQTLATFLRAE